MLNVLDGLSLKPRRVKICEGILILQADVRVKDFLGGEGSQCAILGYNTLKREIYVVISLNPSSKFCFKSQILPGWRGFKSTKAGSKQEAIKGPYRKLSPEFKGRRRYQLLKLRQCL